MSPTRASEALVVALFLALRSASTASMIGVPSDAVYCVSTKLPMLAVARYEAIGSGASHDQVVRPPAVSDPFSRAFATTDRALGHGNLEGERALVGRVSLTGNQMD